MRQRYDFDVDIAKVDYTRILNTSTILEFSTGFFNSVENGPEEDAMALAGIQRSTYPQINRLGQLAGQHNPLGLIPQVLFGNIPTADRNASNGSADAGGPAQVQYDGRWPIYGNDLAFNAAVNLTHTRGRHTYKMGLMREDELFGQARSGIFGGEFNFADDTQHREPHRLRVRQRAARPGSWLPRVARPRARRSPSAHLGVVRAGHVQGHAETDARLRSADVQVGRLARAGRRSLGVQ